MNEELTQQQSDSRGLFSDDERDLLSALDSVQYNPRFPVSDDVDVLQLNGISVATKQNLSCICADSGVGKSSRLEAAAAAIIDPALSPHLGFTRPKGTLPGNVIRFDCEQSRADHWASSERVRARAGVTGDSELFRSYSLTGWRREEMLSAIELAVEETATQSANGLSLVIIDGFADLVRSINNEEESNDCIQRLVSLAINWDTHVMGALHSNPISARGQIAKPRGHLGSEVERKAETLIWMKRKKDGIVHSFTGKTRKAKLPESDAVRMAFNEESRQWETLKPASVEKADLDLEGFRPLLTAAWKENPDATFGKNELARIFAESAGNGLTWGKTKSGHAESLKLILPVTTSGNKKPFKLSPSGHSLISHSKPNE